MTAPVPPTSLVGRHLERLVVDAAIDAGRHGRPATLVVVGEPGIGKSALLNDVCAAHADATVIMAGGVESEQEIPFAALSALIGPLDDRIDQLDAPAARALRAAAQGTAAVPIPVISLALVELLATITDSGPVLVVLDDVHWFDQSSLAVIEFARPSARRAPRDHDRRQSSHRIPSTRLRRPSPSVHSTATARRSCSTPAARSPSTSRSTAGTSAAATP